MTSYGPTSIGGEVARIMRARGMGSALPKRPTCGGKRPPRPTGSRVHRNSPIYVGREGSYPRPIDRKWGDRLWWAAKRFDDRGRVANKAAKPGTREGPLGTAALEVLRYLLDTIDRRSGMLFPAIATIRAAIGRATQTVVSALKRLKLHGFVEWERRVEPTGERGLRGPQVRQASNLYRFAVPQELRHQVEPPRPVDDEWRRQQVAEEAQRMVEDERTIIAAMPPRHALRALFGDAADNPMAAALLRLAANFSDTSAERDSSYQHESLPSHISRRGNERA